MTVDILSEHIEITDGVCGGRPRIAGRRIAVHDVVVWHEKMGQSPDQIASDYDLTLAEIHAALTYYYDHREEIEAELEDEEVFVESQRLIYDSVLIQKLEARRGAKSNPALPG